MDGLMCPDIGDGPMRLGTGGRADATGGEISCMDGKGGGRGIKVTGGCRLMFGGGGRSSAITGQSLSEVPSCFTLHDWTLLLKTPRTCEAGSNKCSCTLCSSSGVSASKLRISETSRRGNMDEYHLPQMCGSRARYFHDTKGSSRVCSLCVFCVQYLANKTKYSHIVP
jgi:hypothetical protein